jgi:hypothetical protein
MREHAIVTLALLILVASGEGHSTGVDCDNPANDIVRENCKPGQPSSVWDVNGAGDPTIQGFATDISYNVGDTVQFKIKTDTAAYRLDIFRCGRKYIIIYNWLGADG